MSAPLLLAALLSATLPAAAAAAAPALRLAFGSGDALHYLEFERSGTRLSGARLPSEATTPLGSVWKLFVHAWLAADARPEQAYRCRGGEPDEVYCCELGQQIGFSENKTTVFGIA